MASRKIKQVIVMRKDLNMRKGKMMAQAAHACMAFLTKNAVVNDDFWTFTTGFFPYDFNIIKEWLNDGFTKIALQVDNLDELMDIYTKALNKGMIVSLITDSGLTEFKGIPTVTCLAIGPVENEEVDKITGHLKLW